MLRAPIGQTALMSLTLRTAAISDQGRVRENNEDAVYAGQRVAAVADGVGGGPAGEVASAIVIRALAELDTGQTTATLAEAVQTANLRLREAIEKEPDLAGMGTTLTALYADGDELRLAHIGDSRAYRWRDGELTQLSRDDTFVQGLVDQGVISSEEARGHPHRSLVTQAMHGAVISPAYQTIDVQPGDRYLLCSDGLSDYVDDADIGDALRRHEDLAECAQALVDLALAAGAPDNVTVALVEPVEVEDRSD